MKTFEELVIGDIVYILKWNLLSPRIEVLTIKDIRESWGNKNFRVLKFFESDYSMSFCLSVQGEKTHLDDEDEDASIFTNKTEALREWIEIKEDFIKEWDKGLLELMK